MKIFARHKVLTIFLAFFILWYLMDFYALLFDFNGLLSTIIPINNFSQILTFILAIIYSSVLLFLISLNEGQKRNDYIKFLLFVGLLSFIFIGIWVFIFYTAIKLFI